MTSILFLNSPITSLASAAIFESGNGAVLFTSEGREVDWQNFVGGLASCASKATSGSTFGCLQNASTTEIFQGISAALAEGNEQFPWDPVIDGPGLIPDLPSALFKHGQVAKLPFITATNLDEGTLFVPPALNSTDEINESFVTMSSPSVSPTTLESSIQTLRQLYPDIPALGSLQ
ncbi:hypothetical protein C8R44DRAFT_742569 [Mycena epipterygia]|nr:hypothetical protein C8R44DRAFT_742569 [Mycena epipterygia]